MTTKNFICPVCGYPELTDPAWDSDLTPSWDICPSCGTHFGNDDFGTTKEEIKSRHIQLRHQWLGNGASRWWSKNIFPPPNWNLQKQLKNIPSEFLDINEKY